LLPVPAGRWSFPTLSPRVFPWMLGPLSRRFVRCSYPFLPPQHRPSPSYHRSALPQFPTQTTSEWKAFRDCSHFIMFGPPSLLAIQVVPTSEDNPQGGHGFYVRAEHTPLPTHASDMLALRTGQLRARGLSPRKTRGLVGRSDRNFLSIESRRPRCSGAFSGPKAGSHASRRPLNRPEPAECNNAKGGTHEIFP
jgi:hypothetical protein